MTLHPSLLLKHVRYLPSIIATDIIIDITELNHSLPNFGVDHPTFLMPHSDTGEDPDAVGTVHFVTYISRPCRGLASTLAFHTMMNWGSEVSSRIPFIADGYPLCILSMEMVQQKILTRQGRQGTCDQSNLW
jgi:hypothetical protein